LLVLAIANGRQAGGGHVLAPEALLDDGLLEIGILPDLPPGERASALHRLLHEGKVSLWRRSITARLPWVELTADEPVRVNLDGEPISAQTLRFEILPGALEACLPEQTPVLRKV